MTFGLPTNMGIPTIQRTAQKQGVALTDEQIQATIDAYHRMAPELEQHSLVLVTLEPLRSWS